ncbi:MAG: winged helix-turn-helix domain-containing protein [Chloroflexota bacterium]|nr:winged helix-turn-helix domain-containing protein [Chloroflexota bacterium]
MNVHESQVEEVIATYPDICAELIGVKEELVLISRQKILPSGDRLDLLFTHRSHLILVELKAVPFREEFLEQTQSYWEQLQQLQVEERLIAGEIVAYLLCPFFLPGQIDSCRSKGINAIEYAPSQVLEMFFSRFQRIAAFFNLRPPDHGVWSLHLLNPILYSLRDGELATRDIQKHVGLALTTVRSHVRFAEEMQLVRRAERGSFQLTEIGIAYVDSRDPSRGSDSISELQAITLRDLIIRDPFASRVILGI